MPTIDTRTDKTTRVARVKQAIVGVNKYYGGQASLTLDGTQYTPASLVQLLQSFVDLDALLTASKAKAHEQVGQEKVLYTQVRIVLQALHGYVVSTFGNKAAAVLADFGFTPTKRTQPKVAVKMEAQKQSAATRAARHTMGQKQKKGVKGAAGAPAPTPATPPKQ